MNAAASTCARSSFGFQHSSFSIPRRGLTLIELLVTIVIMVTVLAGVLPLVSPNNNSRKIREASRQLNTLLSQAQAQAARDGRPVGVAFRETGTSSPFSGMALEAYTIAAPPSFSGFSEHSRIAVTDTGALYGPGGTFTNPSFSPRYNGYKICQLDFLAYGAVDAFPPRTLKIGDKIEVGGNTFLICDDADKMTMPNQTETVGGVEYLFSDPSASAPIPGTVLNAIWLNYHGQQLPQNPTPPVGQSYQITRQPVNTVDQPLQFPRGIGIDMDASGATGLGNFIDFDAGGATTIGIMFSPNGSIDTVYRDGIRLDGIEQIYLLLGLFENGNNGPGFSDGYDFAGFPAADAAELTTRRGQINWLSGDSRWVSVNRAGRIVTSENNVSFDPRTSPYIDDPDVNVQRRKQIIAARQNASNMSSSTGR